VYPQIPAGYALVRQHFTAVEGDGHSYILYGVHNAGGLTAADVCTAAIASWDVSGSLLGVMSNNYTSADVHVVANIGGTLSEADETDGSTGPVTVEPVPPQVSILIQKNTILVGRHGRGRLYVPGCPQTDLNGANTGMLSAGSLATWLDAAATFFDALDTADIPMVLLHRDVSVAPTPVTGLNVEQQVATQRRRNRKAAHKK
jgi:hypothetical protein